MRITSLVLSLLIAGVATQSTRKMHPAKARFFSETTARDPYCFSAIATLYERLNDGANWETYLA